MSFVDLKDIKVSYDGKQNILENLNISIEEGELISLLGPSGCGKTTTLRVIAGLIDPNGGEFIVDDVNLTKVPVHKRNFGMVFQSYALFPHMTIFDNVAFGLKLRKFSKKEMDNKVSEMLKICGLEDLGNRYPKQLSGGQRQRVALARALIIEPKLLLLDEPLSNLDAKLRISMRIEIKRIQQQLGLTTVFVTHDQEECFSISDKVAIMNHGVIEQFDTPENIYRLPKSKFVAEFIGFENFIDLDKQTNGLYAAKNGLVLESTLTNVTSDNSIGTIRPEDIQIVDSGELVGQIKVRTFLGKSYQYEIETDIGNLLVTANDTNVWNLGDKVNLHINKEKFVILEG